MNQEHVKTKKTNYQVVEKIILDNVDVLPEEISLHHNLKNDLGIDSFTLAGIVVDLEKHYDIAITEKDQDRFIVVKDILDHIDRWQEKGK